MNKTKLGAALVAALVVAACQAETTPQDDVTGACAAIVKCHGKAGALAEECHDLGHAGDDVACAKRKDECLAVCSAESDASVDTSAPSQDGAASDAADAATPACVAYCGCMVEACLGKPKVPFTDTASCLTRCAAFSSAEVTCFSAFCAKAKAGGTHDCEHAGGTLGLVECP